MLFHVDLSVAEFFVVVETRSGVGDATLAKRSTNYLKLPIKSVHC